MVFHESIASQVSTCSEGDLFLVPQELYEQEKHEEQPSDENPSTHENLQEQSFAEIGPVLASSHFQWRIVRGGVGVDTGRAGFFDRLHYHDDSIAPNPYDGQTGWKQFETQPDIYVPSLWERMVEEKAMYSSSVFTIPYGLFSASGWGDGVYGLLARTDDSGVVVGARLVFINE